MPTQHRYSASVRWTGNLGAGTAEYKAYARDHEIGAPGKPPIPASADPAFRGDGSRYNPEELLVASLSACHMLWYLHLCAVSGIVVVDYRDEAEGSLAETEDGGGHFTEVVLRPRVTVRPGADLALAEALHARAHALCFIANSVNFTVRHEALVADAP
jgi:organic hydroperoxide reductase OsmC/OhrA